ncbi:hypothetical protein B0A55_00514 [Friedmanniomyces simplex]|uniref:Uncharacterized protein n=1 Tax=Friedmanniomyces simplex TaxID=329884 RepID=A0A4U0Y3Z5_9PEZI|nr:hypothetical protein B0A55_00514 [Friedmanniomyces simplex]
MPICSPPLRKMQCDLSCCGDWVPPSSYWGPGETDSPPRPQPIPELVNRKGITVGDVHEATAQLRREHRLCPYAPAGYLDDEGFVLVQVTFKGSMRLTEGDPMLASRRDELQEEGRNESKTETEGEDRLTLREEYRKAKMDGILENNRKIPTLAEFAANEAHRAAEKKEAVDESANDPSKVTSKSSTRSSSDSAQKPSTTWTDVSTAAFQRRLIRYPVFPIPRRW